MQEVAPIELHLEAEEPVRSAAQQLRLPMEQLKQGLLRRKVVTGRDAWAAEGWDREATPSAGILDISGFESFMTNSLEQLLINLSNEELQLQFNEATRQHQFWQGSQLQRAGAVGEYEDNSDVVALIDGRGGVLEMMDEAGAREL
eukprot:Skav201378  [mRNA]  locus=scaffold3514:84673:88113:- [translate_table: standard]